MPDLSVRLLEVVGIQLVSRERATAGSAPVVIFAETVNSHHFALEYRVGVQTLSCPFSAGGTLAQASWSATGLHASQPKLFVRSSVENLQLLQSRKADFAIVQSDMVLTCPPSLVQG